MLPNGMSAPPVGSPFAKPAASASTPIPKSPTPSGGDPFSKALHHHKAMGHALHAKNAKMAMHHSGHMMLALKGLGGGGKATSGTAVPPTAAPSSVAEESLLPAGMASEATEPTTPTPPGAPAAGSPMAPTGPKGPSAKPGLSAMFAKMRGGR